MPLDTTIADIVLPFDHIFPASRLKSLANKSANAIDWVTGCTANPIVLTEMLMTIESLNKKTVRFSLFGEGIVCQSTVTVRAIPVNVSRFLVAHFRSVLPAPNRAEEVVFSVIRPPRPCQIGIVWPLCIGANMTNCRVAAIRFWRLRTWR